MKHHDWRAIIREHGTNQLAFVILDSLEGYRQNTEETKRSYDRDGLQNILAIVFEEGGIQRKQHKAQMAALSNNPNFRTLR